MSQNFGDHSSVPRALVLYLYAHSQDASHRHIVATIENTLAAYVRFGENMVGPIKGVHESAFWSALRKDCSDFDRIDDRQQPRLWETTPELIAGTWGRVKLGYTYGNAPGGDWSFWVDRYERALTGKEQLWSLLKEIALQGHEAGDYDTFWLGTDAEVNARIMAIVERHRLRDEVRRLKSELETALHASGTSSPVTRAHNLPPDMDMLDGHEALSQPETIIWASLEEAEQELENEKPNPFTLKKVASWLEKVVKTAMQYSAAKADMLLNETVKVVGKGLGGLTLLWVSQNHQVLVRLVEWLKTYAGGLF